MFKNSMYLLVSLVLISCGGNDTKTTTTSDDTNPEVSNVEFRNLAELGTIVGGDVIISSRDEQYDFYTSSTDENGFYTVNPAKLLENIDNKLSTRPKYVLVTVQNGTDIDVNDDGIKDEDGGKPLLGKIKAIYRLDTITSQGELAINLLSTPIAEILQKEKVLDDEKVAFVIKNIGVKDINDDGVIDNQDLYEYKMVDDNSTFEDKLRSNGFLTYLHENNTLEIEKATNKFKQDFNILTYDYTISGNIADISFNKTDENKTIYYGVNIKNNEILNEVYSSYIMLNKNDYVVYKECQNNNCSPINIVAFNGNEVKNYFIKTMNSVVYDDVVQMNQLRNTITDNTVKLIDKESAISDKQKRLDEINRQREILRSRINELK